MKNKVQDGDVLDLAAPYAREAGEGAKIGSIFGVANTKLALSEVGAFDVKGVFELKKTASQAWTVGAKIYWDDTAKECTTVVGSNMVIGVATEAVAGGALDLIGKVRLNGSF